MRFGPRQPSHGAFSVEKCIAHLRWVGVDVTPEMERSWLDAQRTNRFLAGMKRVTNIGYAITCMGGHHRFAEVKGNKRPDTAACSRCGKPIYVIRSLWWRLRDGTVVDNRDAGERWKPLDQLPSLYLSHNLEEGAP